MILRLELCSRGFSWLFPLGFGPEFSLTSSDAQHEGETSQGKQRMQKHPEPAHFPRHKGLSKVTAQILGLGTAPRAAEGGEEWDPGEEQQFGTCCAWR